MVTNFLAIKKEYEDFDKSLLKRGQLPMWDTGVGFYSPAILAEVFELFKKINLQNYKHFLDLGSGDGRVVLTASLFTKATGVEIEPTLISKSNHLRNRLDLKANFIRKNFYDYKISNHDIVFVNPDQPMHRGMENKLLNELRGHVIVHGPHFHPTLLRKQKDFEINSTYMAVYSL
jgi:hypothetical protein|tara:strand:- start:140 stop:664 length:525 start_codon:yes stop_codon:yes gene_type:complete